MKQRWKIFVKCLPFFLLLLGFCYYENHHLVVTQYVYQSEKVPESLSGYRIVQLSDLHNAVFGRQNQKLIQKVQALDPDMIVLTGDIVDSNRTRIDVALMAVEKLADICPVYYVTGNHEYWLSSSQYEKLICGLSDAGAVVLDNESVSIGPDEDVSFSLIGVDDLRLGDGTLAELVSSARSDQLTIVLAHEPQYFNNYVQGAADLVLTGHAHGGQVRLPIIGGVIAPDQGFFPEYTQGQFRRAATTMIVSRGLGNSVVPVRLFNDPEIVLVQLDKEKTK